MRACWPRLRWKKPRPSRAAPSISSGAGSGTDADGGALIEVLRANGSVIRPADDDAMLDLCGVLAKLMDGIDGSPFDFAPGSQKWVALFDAGSEV